MDDCRATDQCAWPERTHYDARHYPAFEQELAHLAIRVEGLLLRTPPNIVRRTWRNYLALGKLGLETLRYGDAHLARLIKIMTQSVRAYLDERFESDAIKATLATDGVIGTNGGPSTPGTAYVMLHHVMGGATGMRGLWGFVRGGMGAISAAIAASAQSCGASLRTQSAVARVLVRRGRAYGVVLDKGVITMACGRLRAPGVHYRGRWCKNAVYFSSPLAYSMSYTGHSMPNSAALRRTQRPHRVMQRFHR